MLNVSDPGVEVTPGSNQCIVCVRYVFLFRVLISEVILCFMIYFESDGWHPSGSMALGGRVVLGDR